MGSLINKSSFLIVIMAFFIACAPNRAMTKNSDGVAGHSGTAKTASASEDATYADDDEFNVDDVELENAAPAKVKSSNTKTAVKTKKPSSGDDNAVAQASSGNQQKGVASWYGREFNGKKTASGEKFNMNDLTAAHKTFPLGSIALVKNLDNGKTVRVRINDRGPFAKNRVIDLSYAAAKKIDMVSSGEANVSIKLIGAAAKDYSLEDDADDESLDADDDVPPVKTKKSAKIKGVASSSADTGSDLALQTGAFHTKKNADKMKSRLEELFPGKDVQVSHDGAMYKVKVAGIATRKEAERCRKVLTSEEIESFISGQE